MSTVKGRRWARTLRCEDAFRHLDDYMDGTLLPEQGRLVEEHLRECAQCLEEYTFERSLLDHLAAKLKSLEVPQGLDSRISQRIREASRRIREEVDRATGGSE